MSMGHLQQDRRDSADGDAALRPGAWAVAGDRLRRRFRSRGFFVLLGVSVVVLLVLTALSYAVAWAMAALSNGADTGPLVYSAVVFWVLMMAIVAAPAVQGRAVHDPALVGGSAGSAPHRDRPAGSASGLVLGALLAEWATSLIFVAVALPVLLIVAVAGGVGVFVVAGSLAVLIAEILVLGAVAVGVSGLSTRPGRSVVTAYGVVAVLTVGSVLVFGFVGNLLRHEVVTESRGVSWSSTELIADCDAAFADGASDCVEDADGEGVTTCEAWQTTVEVRPRLDLAWWALAPNPFVVVADATPPTYEGTMQSPVDLFGMVTAGVRQAQLAGETTEVLDSCTIDGQHEASTVPGLIERTASSWYLGLLVQAALAAGLLVAAVSRRAPRASVPSGDA